MKLAIEHKKIIIMAYAVKKKNTLIRQKIIFSMMDDKIYLGLKHKDYNYTAALMLKL